MWATAKYLVFLARGQNLAFNLRLAICSSVALRDSTNSRCIRSGCMWDTLLEPHRARRIYSVAVSPLLRMLLDDYEILEDKDSTKKKKGIPTRVIDRFSIKRM